MTYKQVYLIKFMSCKENNASKAFTHILEAQQKSLHLNVERQKSGDLNAS